MFFRAFENVLIASPQQENDPGLTLPNFCLKNYEISFLLKKSACRVYHYYH